MLQLNPLNRFRLRSIKVADEAKVRAPAGLAVFMALGSLSSFTTGLPVTTAKEDEGTVLC